jgi:hypothetical protein
MGYCLITVIVSCDDIFVDDISDESITLIAPNDSLLTQELNHTFVWEKLQGATEYQVIISAGAVLTDTIVAKTSLFHKLDTGVYQWCVRGMNGGYETPFSCRSLEIGEKIPEDISAEIVVLTAPSNNLETKNTKQVFLWESVEGATKYELIIASPSLASPENGVVTKVLNTTTYTAELELGKYQWCVKAMNRKYKTENSCNFLEVIDED